MKQTSCSKCGEKIQGSWCAHCETPNLSWCRVKEGSKIFGVCQGLSLYTHLPVVAIRLAFIIAAVFGGWGIILYLILCLFPVRDTAVESSPVPQEENVSIVESSLKILHKFFSFIIFVVLCACLYLPLFTICTIAVIASVVGWFYPYLQIGVYQCTFFELGAIGFLWGICNPLLGMLTIYLIVHWILTFHFKKWQWSFAKTVIIWFAIATTCISSLWMFRQLHREVQCRTWSITTANSLSQIFMTENIPIRRVFFATHQQDHTRVTYVLQTHELSTNTENNIGNIDMLWDEKPRWYNLHKIKKSFAYFDIFVYMPENQDLELPNISHVHVTGKWRTVFLENNKNVALENAEMRNLNVNIHGGKVYVENVKVDTMYLYLTDCTTMIDFLHGQDSKIYQNNGWLEIVDFTGKMQLQNISGQCKIERPLFENMNEITSDSGKISVRFLHDFVPSLNCSGENITNFVPQFPTQNVSMNVVSKNARVILNMYTVE